MGIPGGRALHWAQRVLDRSRHLSWTASNSSWVEMRAEEKRVPHLRMWEIPVSVSPWVLEAVDPACSTQEGVDTGDRQPWGV